MKLQYDIYRHHGIVTAYYRGIFALGSLAALVVYMPTPATATTTFALTKAGSQTAESGLRIDPSPTICALVGRFPMIKATIGSDSPVDSVRVFFHAEDASHWYSVEMRQKADAWVAILPKPARSTKRIGYYVVASDGFSRKRVPEATSFLIDVVAEPCHKGTADYVDTAMIQLGVPHGAPRVPEGFEDAGILSFLETPQPENVPSTSSLPRSLPPAVSVGSTVRIATDPLAGRYAVRVVKDSKTVTMVDSKGRDIALVRPGRTLVGRVASLDDESMTLDVGEHRLKVRIESLDSLEVRHQSPFGQALPVIGALAGAAGGLSLSLASCLVVDWCEDGTPLLVGTIVGTTLGATTAGSGIHWEPVDLGRNTRVGVAIRQQPRSGSIGLSVRF
jgi:hypothetical protein